MPRAGSVLVVFLDGVGIGSADARHNPFLQADLPTLRGLLAGAIPTLETPEAVGPSAAAFPLDASLGVPGTPRSGTGQTALLTGRNAPRLHGAHFGPWAPVKLRSLLAEESVLRRARRAGLRVAFANAYPRGYLERVRPRLVAPVTLAAGAAGLVTRSHEALAEGRAVASEIVSRGWRERLGHRVPEVTPREAGRSLSRIAASHDLTLFAHYDTDHAGHLRRATEAVAALERVDAFVGGILEGVEPGSLLLIASDHGNVEDLRVQHTRHPALGLLVGSAAGESRRSLGKITDVAPAVLRWLGFERSAA